MRIRQPFKRMIVTIGVTAGVLSVTAGQVSAASPPTQQPRSDWSRPASTELTSARSTKRGQTHAITSAGCGHQPRRDQ
jgi:hypothetical protein